jgi:hypothetical protein
MRRLLSTISLAVLGLLLAGSPAFAQQQASALPVPRLMSIFPNGGKAGTTVEATFTGTDTEEPEKLIFNHAGITSEPILPPDPTKPDPKKPPMKAAVTKFKVTIAANVPVGHYDARLVNKWGVSNARAFVVGDLAEVAEVEPNNDLPQAQKIEINNTVNGTLSSGTDVDYFTFPGKKGQRVIISCLASSIDSRLHPVLQAYDSRNRLLGENRNYNGTDALLDVTLPDDGACFVRLFQFTHISGPQGNEFFYRLTVSTAPWIDAVYPPVIERGKSAQVTVYGRNLPGAQPDSTVTSDGIPLEKVTLTAAPPASPNAGDGLTYNGYVAPNASNLEGFEFRVKNATGSSNPYLITYARAPVILEKEPNDTPETAQDITVPCELAGRIDKRRDRDFYTFSAKKGDVLHFDLFSERLGVEGYPYFIIRSVDGKQTYAQQEDAATEALSMKFYARTDDPAPFRFNVPADGKYQLVIGTKTSGILFGPRNVYCMKIVPEQPDFRVIILGSDSYRPGTATILKGGSEQLTVLAWRQDGFNGDITLTVEGLPAGVTCPPQVIGGGLKFTPLVLSAAASAADWTGEIKVKATATIGGKTVVHEARPAGITWPIQVAQNFPRISRLEKGLALAVRGQAPFDVTATIDKPQVVQGTNAVITLKLNRIWPDFKQALALQPYTPQGGQTLAALPQGLTVANVNIAAGANEAKVNVTVPANIPPGTYNIVLRSQVQIPYSKDPMAKQKPNTQVVLPTAPVSLTVIPKTLANFTLAAPNVNVKAGATAEVVVRVARQFNFDGEFKLVVELPPGTQGVTIAPVTIPAGQTEAKLMVQAAAGAMPGNRANLNVKATAMFDKTPVVHEAKLSVNVTK